MTPYNFIFIVCAVHPTINFPRLATLTSVFLRSKKQAKHVAAENALKSFVQFKDACEAQQVFRKRPFENLDFTNEVTGDERLMKSFVPGTQAMEQEQEETEAVKAFMEEGNGMQP